MSFFKSGEKPREQYRLPQGSFIQADQWMDYLGYEQYCWWLKFHSWVNRSSTRLRDNHIPYTLESVFEKLGVSKANFYKKIKVLWESGLIEIVEFEPDERKSQKPRNILVYDYPFNDSELEYKPLTKLRDWKKDYDSQSKLAGIKGALLKKSTKTMHRLNLETVEIPVDNHRLNLETVEKNVDNSDGLHLETVEKNVDKYGLHLETVAETVDKPQDSTVSIWRPNKDTNNIKNIIKEREYLFNNSLINITVEDIKNILTEFTFTEGEINDTVEMIIQRKLFNISKSEIFRQAQYMLNRNGIISRPAYFVKGVETNLGRIYPERKEQSESVKKINVPFYNWLEE